MTLPPGKRFRTVSSIIEMEDLVSSRSLLLVDPDPAAHELLQSLLGRPDRTIQNAYDPQEGLNHLRDSECDVVVAAAAMNGDDPLQFLRRVRAVRPEARVIVTGEPNAYRVVSAIRARAFSYFHKPLSETGLADMVDHALEASAWKEDIRVISGRPEWITLDIRCKLEAVERSAQFLRELQADLPQLTREDIAGAFRELLMNAIEHGGKSDPRKHVRASFIRIAQMVMVYIHDPGEGFSLDSLPHAAISNPEGSPTKHVEFRAEEGRRPGGFGILMTRNLVDDLLYNERGNSVLFVKYLK
jgi:DNA-binding NarL/FixJ family response regulator